MKFDDLPYRCKFCNHLRVTSLMMDGNHEYGCHKCPITKEKREGNCKNFEGDLPSGENNGSGDYGLEICDLKVITTVCSNSEIADRTF